MACLQLDKAQTRTLHEMGIHHPHQSVRQRAQALQQLARGETLAVVSARFGVHLNSVENWARWWRQRGVVGLFQPPRPGRPLKWDAARQHALGSWPVSVAVARASCWQRWARPILATIRPDAICRRRGCATSAAATL